MHRSPHRSSALGTFRSAATAGLALGLLLAASAATAAPVRYSVVSPFSALTFVGLEDQADPNNTTPCPPSVSSCLRDRVVISEASVLFDAETGELTNLSITLSETGHLDMGGLNGYEHIAFTGTNFQSSGTTTLAVDPGGTGGGLTTWQSASVVGELTIDNIVLDLSGGGSIVLPMPGDPGPAYESGSTPSIVVRAALNANNELTLGIQGVEIGEFQDLRGGNPLTAKADFNVVVTAVPEPGAAILFGAGLLVAGRFARREGRPTAA